MAFGFWLQQYKATNKKRGDNSHPNSPQYRFTTKQKLKKRKKREQFACTRFFQFQYLI